MKHISPQKLKGASKPVKWLNRLHEQVRQARPAPGINARLMQTTRGTMVVATPPSGGAAKQLFRGEWSSFTLYAKGETVKVSGGPAAGSYIASKATAMFTNTSGRLEAETYTYPWRGEYWIQLGRLDTAVWL